ncbi:MAG: amidohydrolase family protein [bacterium]|nr:amidohydrolase family protein [bacterium]
MKIYNISNIVFSGKIIDSHMHVGNWYGSKYQYSELDTFIKNPLSNGDTIEKIIVSNLSAIDKNEMLDELEGNKEILKIAENNPKIAPLAVCQPKTGSVENIKKLFDENPNKFVGLKFHPDGHEIMATSNLFDPYLMFAQEKNLPCLFHCGIQWENGKLADEAFRYSEPEKIYQAAKKVPKTPVIMAHLGAGGETVHSKAIQVLMDSIDKKDANLYADISWVDIDKPNKPTIVNLIKKLKEKNALDRILFGSDAPIGEFANGKDGLTGKEFYEKTIVDIKTAIKNNFNDDADSIIDKIFYQNAEKLFFNKENGQTEIKSNPKTKKVLAITFCGLAIVGAIFALCTKNSNSTKDIEQHESQKVIIA